MKLLKAALMLGGVLTASGCLLDAPDPTVDANSITFNDLAVHDPSVVRADDGSYYVFGSHLAAARSTDLMNWQYVANGVDAANPLWSTIPTDGNTWTGAPGSWAADVIKLKDGKYRFYYSFCGIPPNGECTGPRAYLGVAIADNIAGPYTDQGIFLRSGMNAAEIAAGYGPEGITSYDARIHPNTIDPDTFYDKKGKLWMTYGSYSGGIFILQLDETTGKPLPAQGYGKHLAGGNHSAIEGSYILYSPVSDYYYMFMSFGGFVSTDGYNVRIARSKNPDGPYLDAEGRDLVNARGDWDAIAPYGVKLMGGFNFNSAQGDPETSRGYLAPGHNSAYYDTANGRHLLITHTRFPNRGEGHSIRVHEMFVNADGWLVASPHRYVPIKGKNVVDATDLPGDYKFINLGKDINRTAKQSVYISLNADYTISGAVKGTYQRYLLDPSRITIQLDGIAEPFEGRLAFQWNEAAGKLVPVFTALSSKGVSIWGSRLETRTTRQVLKDVADSIALPDAAKDEALTLPAIGTRGATITWQSSDPSILGIDGSVTRPNVGEGDRVVTLTAIVRLNGVTSRRTFQVTVPQRLPFNRVAQFSFENSLVESLGNFPTATATGNRIWNAGAVGFAAGREGQAVDLNGASGVRLPDGLISNYEYTVSFWANPRAVTAFTTAFFGAVNEQVDPAGAPFSTRWLSFLPQSWDGNTMLWSGSEAWFDGSAGQRIAANTWTHMAFSVKRGVVTVYLNGVPRFSAGNIGDFFTKSTGRFALGVNYWDLPFNGLIDELKVYEASLVGEEIRALDIDQLPTADLLASAASLLNPGDVTAVRSDLQLPRTGPYASAVSWTSSDPSVIATNGKVTRPGRDAPDAQVILTATITLGGQQIVREFDVTVKSLAPPAPVAAYGFEDSLDASAGSFGAGVAVGPRIDQPGGNASFTNGVAGRALVLDGTSGVRLPDNILRDHSYSISLWLNPTVASQFTTAFFGWANGSSWISVVPRGPGSAQNTMLWSGTAWFDGTFNSAIPVGLWSHLVMVVNNGTLSLYLNGQLANTMTGFPDVFTPAASTQFALGVNYWDTPYNGLVDELKLFNEVLVDENVQTLYAEGAGTRL
ncbi:arabinan endo-1,5-alpha-L-arabinosidase [Povalibacter uvarum]|uniref:Arabinan endo-1,5-alpha-L-arabinosidase n=1 Tax=Povalibacter uvarum TaxID=732238 RepID=A0A841HMZ2_9GAMM|nr:LamG-like jellyroll fold domain-containing protein [Povalibacter uvarum]MBB6093719.1 arabinan endo-1,5-alpha-L-arabinosidase [Povalibacter uvarum]